jgi:hypothetical protein
MAFTFTGTMDEVLHLALLPAADPHPADAPPLDDSALEPLGLEPVGRGDGALSPRAKGVKQQAH